MKCFVCGGEMKPYFVKKFGAQYLPGLDTFEYVRCEHCGLNRLWSVKFTRKTDSCGYNVEAQMLFFFRNAWAWEKLSGTWIFSGNHHNTFH